MSIWRVYDALGNILEQGSNAAANAHDGNTTTYYTLYPPELVDAPYIIEEDFGQPVTVTQFKVYPTNVDAFNWVRVEYWTGSTWALVGTATTNNAWNTFSGSWTTSKWRVKWEGNFEFGSFVNINEMQAVVGTTTINVFDSGTGTESATRTSFGSTLMVYDAYESIIEQGTNAAAAAHDDDTSTYYTLYNPYYAGFEAPNMIEEDFGQTVTVTQFKVYVTNANAYNYASVVYWTGSSWALVGYATTNGWNTFSGSWTASKWRVGYLGEIDFGDFVRVNEMQAVVGATTIDVSDSGSGSETATVSIIITASDSGTGTETASTLFTVVVSDNGAGTDLLTDRTLLGLTDTGSGTELATLSETLIMVTDSGAGTETVAAIPHFFVTDSGWGSEAPAPIVTFYLTDTGEGVEGLLRDLQVYDASSLSGEEIALVLGQIDEGSGADELPLRLVGVLDDGTGQEASTLILIAKDNGVGRELAVVTNLLSASDEGSGLEKPLRVIHIGAFVFLRPD